jgi:predicted GNAT superfamily acetyltransferase
MAMSLRKETARDYSILPCRTVEEFARCVKLQQEIWGYTDLEVYPLRLFVNLNKIGGQVLGAFTRAGEIVGFVAAMPAWRGRRRYWHSLSLGIRAGHENRGLGRTLKLAQRRGALAAGVDSIEWSFDPMRAKNAFFNIERLGAVCRRYFPNYYGAVESRLQQGLPSDRLIAEWWIKSGRAKRALAGKPRRKVAKGTAEGVAIPLDFERIARQDPERARELQTDVRRKLMELFRKRMVITGFAREVQAGRYLLEQNED